MPKVLSFKTLWERPSPTSISRARAKVSGALNSVTRAVQRTARAHRTSASSSSVASSFEDVSTSSNQSSQDIESPPSTILNRKDTDSSSEVDVEVVSTSSSDAHETSSGSSFIVPATPCDAEESFESFTRPTSPPETLYESIVSHSLQEQAAIHTHLPVNPFADSHATPVISTYHHPDTVVNNSINIQEEEATPPSYTDLACNTGLVDAWTTISSPSSGAIQHPEQRTLSSPDSLFASGMLVDPRAVPMEVFFSSSHLKRKRTPDDEDQSSDSDRAHDYHYATDRPSKRRATATFNIPKLIVPDHPIPTEATRRQQEHPVGAQTHYVDVFMTSDNESDSEASSSSSSDTSSSSAASFRGRSRIRRARDFRSRRRSAAPSPPPSSYASSCFEDASYDLSYSEVQIKSEPLF